jgi:hypothetical protein
MYVGLGRGDNLWITLLGHPHGGLAPHKKHSGCVSQNITGDVLYVVFFWCHRIWSVSWSGPLRRGGCQEAVTQLAGQRLEYTHWQASREVPAEMLPRGLNRKRVTGNGVWASTVHAHQERTTSK